MYACISSGHPVIYFNSLQRLFCFKGYFALAPQQEEEITLHIFIQENIFKKTLHNRKITPINTSKNQNTPQPPSQENLTKHYSKLQ